MNAHEAALRVAAFLDNWRESNGTSRDFLLVSDKHNRCVLRVSDLRALIAAVPSEEPAPFMWFMKDGRMWHAGCGKEVLLIDGIDYLCECGRGNT